MGTRYRESEYDLENSKDLIEAIENTTAEFMDYINYWGEISTIIENFDQSIEVFHPDRMAQRILGMGDILSVIEKAEETFDMEQAEKLEKQIRK